MKKLRKDIIERIKCNIQSNNWHIAREELLDIAFDLPKHRDMQEGMANDMNVMAGLMERRARKLEEVQELFINALNEIKKDLP